MRKVLFICPTGDLRGGGEISNFELIRYLKLKGYDVYAVTRHDGRLSKELSKINVKNIPGNYSGWEVGGLNAWQSRQSISDIYDFVKKIKPDVIVTNTLHIPWGAVVAGMLNIPHIWITREFTEGEFAYLHDRMRYVLSMSNRVVANSGQLADYTENKYGIPVGKFYSYVDASQLRLSERKSTRIVFPATINDRKNQEDLIRAMGYIKKIRPDFSTKAILYGASHPDYKKFLVGIIKKENLENLIELNDFVYDPWLKVGVNDILVQTSLRESIGRTTTEAMKLGVPVILSNNPGHLEAISMGGGYSYELRDYKDLANKILYVIDNYGEAKKKAIGVMKKVKETMNTESTNGLFIKYIEEVVNKDNPFNAVSLLESLVIEGGSSYIEQDKKIHELSAELTDIYESRRWKLSSKIANYMRFSAPKRKK